MTTAFMSMPTKLSDLDDQQSGANLQTEGHTLTPPTGWSSPGETEALGSAPSHSPSQSLARKPMAWSPWDLVLPRNTCDSNWRSRGGTTSTPCLDSALVEDMCHHGRTGLTKAVVTGLRRAVLFYGRQSLGEGLSLGEVRDATFTLTGAGTWVGKLAYLAADPLTLWDDWWVIAQAITQCQIEARGPGHPHSQPATPQPFRFYHRDESPLDERFHSANECLEEALLDHQPSCHRLQWGWGHDHQWLEQTWAWLQPPSPSPDWGLDSDRSSVSTTSSVSSWSDRSEASQHPHHCRHHRETGGHMKINLPIFKYVDVKDAITYQSWRWDLTVYHCAGCWDCTLLPYTSGPYKGTLESLWRVLGWT